MPGGVRGRRGNPPAYSISFGFRYLLFMSKLIFTIAGQIKYYLSHFFGDDGDAVANTDKPMYLSPCSIIYVTGPSYNDLPTAF